MSDSIVIRMSSCAPDIPYVGHETADDTTDDGASAAAMTDAEVEASPNAGDAGDAGDAATRATRANSDRFPAAPAGSPPSAPDPNIVTK